MLHLHPAVLGVSILVDTASLPLTSSIGHFMVVISSVFCNRRLTTKLVSLLSEHFGENCKHPRKNQKRKRVTRRKRKAMKKILVLACKHLAAWKLLVDWLQLYHPSIQVLSLIH